MVTALVEQSKELETDSGKHGNPISEVQQLPSGLSTSKLYWTLHLSCLLTGKLIHVHLSLCGFGF